MSSQSVAPATEKHPVPLLDATLIRSVPLSSCAQHLTFQVEREERLEFLPGQSVRIEMPMHGSPISFAYSIASSPRGDNRFELCLKRGNKGSAADSLCELKEGTQIRSTRPQGAFVLQEPAADAIFLAAGTGIAPIRSMVHWLMRFNDDRSSRVWLVFGARNNDSLFFDDEFLRLARQHSNFHYIPTLSSPDSQWAGACGYVQDHLHSVVHCAAPIHAYVCGPAVMVSSVRRSLTEHGWPDDLVHYDRHEF